MHSTGWCPNSHQQGKIHLSDPSRTGLESSPLPMGTRDSHTLFYSKRIKMCLTFPLCSEAYALTLHWSVGCYYTLRLPTHPKTWAQEALGSTGADDIPAQADSSSLLAQGLKLATRTQAGVSGWVIAAWTFKWYQTGLSLQQAKSELTKAKPEPHHTCQRPGRWALQTVLAHAAQHSFSKANPTGHLWQKR